MKKILRTLQTVGKAISRFVVNLCLFTVYFIIIASYSMFIKFNRNRVIRNKVFRASDLDQMF